MTGFYLFTDKKRLLLSSLLIVTQDEANPLKDLKYPLFLYVACTLTIFGMIIISFVLFVGCWTSFMNNCCLLSTYFIMILSLLLTKFAICVIIAMWPQCLGLNVSVTEMVRVMQGSYGVPGFEQYTVAMDFAQTFLDCCAINDSINYDTSLWRLQKFGKKELTVPLTCCMLMNRFEENSYLDPIPVNETLCQSLQPHEFLKGRHLDGCLEKINYWYREHYVVLLCAGLVLVLVEFFVLLTIVLNCTSIKQKQLRRNCSAEAAQATWQIPSNATKHEKISITTISSRLHQR